MPKISSKTGVYPSRVRIAATQLRVWRNSGETDEMKTDGWLINHYELNYRGDEPADLAVKALLNWHLVKILFYAKKAIR